MTIGEQELLFTYLGIEVEVFSDHWVLTTFSLLSLFALRRLLPCGVLQEVGVNLVTRQLDISDKKVVMSGIETFLSMFT